MFLKDLFDKTKIFVAACFWYAIGMRVRARNRFRILFGHANTLLYRNAQISREVCAAQATLSEADLERAGEEMAGWNDAPLISVVMPVYNTDPDHLRAAIASVKSQIYSCWELCVADDASSSPKIREVLDAEMARDHRIKVVYREENGHIAAATNSAIALATGEYVALMDHDDLLVAHALYTVAKEIIEHRDADLIYSDEDKIRGDGRLDGPHFKSDWNEELFLAQNYVNHLSVLRRSLVSEIGGFRSGYEGSQDHDLILRFIRKTTPDRIRHIPQILYHWRAYQGSGSFSDHSLSMAIEARQRAVREYLADKYPDQQFSVTRGPHDCNRIWRELPHPAPKVSIVIPTRDHFKLLKTCVSSILERTSYPDYEIIIINNNSENPEILRYFQQICNDFDVKILDYDASFNFAEMNNIAVESADGQVMVMLNNDTEVISSDWLRELVSHAVQPHIGCVGARLLYKNKSVQHAGVILGVGGIANHAFHGYPAKHTGYNARLQLPQYVSAVTGACLAIEKNKYLAVGGMDGELFKVAYNDIDLCLSMSEHGLNNVYTPYAELFHYESMSRGRDVSPDKQRRLQAESDNMREKWGDRILKDPFYNENFSQEDGCYKFQNP